MPADTLIIIPTYNEIENVSSITKEIVALHKGYHILFVDDNSPDGTALEIVKLQVQFPGLVFLEKRSGKMGLGTAYLHGFDWALKNNYTYIFEMDCDFSHNPKYLNDLRQACVDGAGLAIGSRYCKGGKVKNWPIKRVLMSYFASVYVRLILLINIRDTTSGFKCYHKDVLNAIQLKNNVFKGYAFQICMKYATLKHGFKVRELPIVFVDRLFGTSKMSSGIFKEALIGVWQMKKMKL
jgi:dolichol-phosphate mannosyltransferase